MQNFRALRAPPADTRASGGWGLCPQTPKTAPPLRISGYAPVHDSEDLDGWAKMANRIHENDSRVSRTAASSAGHFSHVTKTPTTSLSLDSVSDKLNDLSVCVERLNDTVSNLSQSHPPSQNTFSPTAFFDS